MSFHVVAFHKQVSPGSSYVDLPAVDDGVLTVQNGHIISGYDNWLFAAYTQANDLVGARIVTPSLKAQARSQIRPFERNSNPPTDPGVSDICSNPILLKAREELAVEGYHDYGFDEQVYAVLWLSRGLRPPPKGEVLVVRGTSTTGASLWTTFSMTWDIELPRGQYAVVGCEHISSYGIAHRLMFDGGGYRPGGLSQTALTRRTHPMSYSGRLGTWGTFGAPVMPRVQVYTTGGDTDHTVYLHVVRLGDAEARSLAQVPSRTLTPITPESARTGLAKHGVVRHRRWNRG